MFVTVFAVNGSVLSPQPGNPTRMVATPRAARLSAIAVKPPASSLLPPCPCAMTTSGTFPSMTGSVSTAGTLTPRERTETACALSSNGPKGFGAAPVGHEGDERQDRRNCHDSVLLHLIPPDAP